MATVRVLNAERMEEIEATAITYAYLDGNNLILRRHNMETINVGNIRGEKGDKGDDGDPGEVTTADMNVAIASAVGAAIAPHGCQVVRSTGQGIANNSATPLEFTGTDIWDTDGYHNPASNPDRITIPSGLGGVYILNAAVRMASNNTGHRDLGVTVNGASQPSGAMRLAAINGQDMFQLFTYHAVLSAGDIVRFTMNQTSGASLNSPSAWAHVQRLSAA